MISYLVTREGRELGTFKTSKIEKGLQTGFFRVSDLAWHEAVGWRGLFEIVGSDKAAASPSGASLLKSAGADLPLSAMHRAGSSCVVAPAVLAALSGTRPWVRLIAVMMGISCAIVIAAGFAWMADGAHAPGNHLALWALSALLSLYPALKLTQYAVHIDRLVKSQSHADLTAALTEQRLFWKFHGILLVVFMVLFFLLIAAGSGFIGLGLS